jgi:hypothetical protein
MGARATERVGIAALLSPSLPAFAVPEEGRGLPVPGLRRLLEPRADLRRALRMLAVERAPLEDALDGLNGLIANDKFCWARTLKLHLSWSRARSKLKWPTPRHLSAEVSPHGAEHAAEAHLARPADRRADGDRPAALGPGLPASPAMGGNASSCADRGAGAPNPAGDVSCE